MYTAGEYAGSYKYGAWGRDAKPKEGKENWYWLVMLTSGNKYSNYVRLYSTLSSLIVGVSTPGKELHVGVMAISQNLFLALNLVQTLTVTQGRTY